MKRLAAAAATALFLLTACSSDVTPTPNPRDVASQGAEKTQDAAKDAGKQGKKERRSAGESPGGASAGGASADGGDTSEDREDPANDESSGGSASRYPAAGTYTFAQSGYEEFCNNAGSCEKEQLPKRQPTEISYESSSNDSALVLAVQKQSQSRETRTWTRFSPAGASITKVHVEFNYSGFGFNRTYEPQPPVEALRFPLKEGASWSGEWKADTSGSYSVKVGDRTQIDVGGRSVSAYRVETTTEFRGDFQGKSRLTAYVDPDTKALVATEGVLNVTSNFGRYSTVFETRLAGGPGY